eukprot:5700157-Pyramimonas_sp.AAC.1
MKTSFVMKLGQQHSSSTLSRRAAMASTPSSPRASKWRGQEVSNDVPAACGKDVKTLRSSATVGRGGLAPRPPSGQTSSAV